jgi:DNA-binding GntR family transcriptional regulator
MFVTRPNTAYRRVERAIRDEVLRDGSTGKKLPTEAELAAEHGVSRQTVRRAFQDLVKEGLVVRVPGRGTFVAEHNGRYLRQFGSIDDLMGLSLDTELELIKPLGRRIDVSSARRLGLDADVISTVIFRRLHDEVPFCVTTVHLPPDVAARLGDIDELTRVGARGRVTIIGLLDGVLDSPIAEAEQSVTAAAASAEQAEILEAEVGVPILAIDRTYFDTKGRPVEFAVSQFLPEHYSYRVRLTRSLS